VTRVEIRPFADEHLDGAARLLAERHERHRTAEPLLPAEVDFAAEIEKERDELGGAVALQGGEVVGYLLGARHDRGGPHVRSSIAGHAVRDPEVVRDLYALAAAGWVDAGLRYHFVFVPAIPELIDPWFRLAFGASAALAARETAPQPLVDARVVIRESAPEDARTAARLDNLMIEAMLPSPSFSTIGLEDEEALAAEWAEVWDEPEKHRHFIAEREGRAVGHILLYRRPPDLRVPAESIDLSAASTAPEERGTGVGLALTHHVLGWAHENGVPVMTTDWRMTNLWASRFWPRRGFRPSFIRLERCIP
jgi:GNAT superfamily N-acetyltransferase